MIMEMMRHLHQDSEKTLHKIWNQCLGNEIYAPLTQRGKGF